MKNMKPLSPVLEHDPSRKAGRPRIATRRPVFDKQPVTNKTSKVAINLKENSKKKTLHKQPRSQTYV